MGNHIYKKLLQRKIEEFASTFEHDSNSIFKNREGKLIHPGEYGMYKEKAFKQLLSLFLSKEFSLGDGFIITATDKISTQCDIVIYDSNVAPIIQNGLTQFFPIEVVKGVCEIKSTLSKADFIKALRKLSSTKALSDELCHDFASHNCMRNLAYAPTFLVCNKLDFDFEKLELEEIYGDIPRKYWHNAVLSLEDGVIHYSYKVKDLGIENRAFLCLDTPADLLNSIDCGYASLEFWQHGKSVNCLDTAKSIESASKEYEHILLFLANLGIIIEEHEFFEFDAHKYLDVDYKPGMLNLKKSNKHGD